MSNDKKSATRPGALRARIRTIEQRIGLRRDNIGVALDSIAENARAQMTAPITIIGAGLFGAAIHRSHLLSHLLDRLEPMSVYRSAITGLRFLQKATSPTIATPG